MTSSAALLVKFPQINLNFSTNKFQTSKMRTRHWPSILLALTCLVASVRTALPEEQPRATIGEWRSAKSSFRLFNRIQFELTVLLHRRGARCFDDAVNETMSAAALQREQSAQWATEIINNQTAAHMLSIGTTPAGPLFTQHSTHKFFFGNFEQESKWPTRADRPRPRNSGRGRSSTRRR